MTKVRLNSSLLLSFLLSSFLSYFLSLFLSSLLSSSPLFFLSSLFTSTHSFSFLSSILFSLLFSSLLVSLYLTSSPVFSAFILSLRFVLFFPFYPPFLLPFRHLKSHVVFSSYIYLHITSLLVLFSLLLSSASGVVSSLDVLSHIQWTECEFHLKTAMFSARCIARVPLSLLCRLLPDICL